MCAPHRLLLVLACLALAACQRRGPEQDFHAFISALQQGDAEAVWQSFSEGTRAQLAAYLAQNAPPSQRQLPPQQLLVHHGLLRSMREIVKVEVLNQSQDRAVLEITDELEERQQITLVMEQERWRIVLELPAAGA